MHFGKREWLGTITAGLLVASALLLAAAPSEKTSSKAEPAPPLGLRPIPETLDFGRVDPYEPNVRTVEIHNDGQRPVTLSNVKSSCRCTLAALREYTVPPGGTVPLEIRLELREHNSDTVRTQVNVTTFDPLIPIATLNVSADIIPEITVEPAELDLGKVKQGREASGELRVRRAGKPEAKLIGLETPPEWTASFKEVEPGTYALRLALKPDTPIGLHAGRMVLLTDVKRRPRVEVPLRAESVGIECTLSPKVLVFGPNAPGDSIGVLELRNPEPLRITEVKCPPKTFTWTDETLEDGRRLRLSFTLAPDAPEGKLTGKIGLVLQEGERHETREIPFFGTVQPESKAP